ncbi:MAG: proprotein convertase P-domain-containing protein, partial [Myxococcales bacterium]|nr:proprotein convertase P-domain-containing protein [Myxococcales bacterium]
DGCNTDCTLPQFIIAIDNPAANLIITDNAYDGTIASMVCVDLDVVDAGTVVDVTVTITANHNWVGDTTAKLVSPSGTVITLHSRPGLAEVADDGTQCCGDSSDLVAAGPISYNAAFTEDAETMGNTINGTEDVCISDLICDYLPNPGAAIPGTLGDLAGETVTGTWQVCMGDSAGSIIGTLVGAGLSIVATP